MSSGDYLVKIAAEHGTTWQAIWNHPENAELRNRRSGPDELYPGDVLAIDVPSDPPTPDRPAPQPPAPVPPIAPPELPVGPPLPPWPYPELPTPTGEPRWDCPGGICVCHPVDPFDEREEKVIVLYDGLGLRMPMAWARVYEGGRLLHPQQADALGELRVELLATTKTVQLEWAPVDLPSRPELPYHKRYHVRLGAQLAQASITRLANLGFSRGHSANARVRHYQRAYHQPETGKLEDVAPQVSTRHDHGKVPPFTPVPGSPPAPSPGGSSSSSFDAPPATADELSSRSERRFADFGFLAAPDAASSTGGSGSGSKGSVVPELGHLEVLAQDQDFPDVRPAPDDVVVVVRSLDRNEEVQPSTAPEELHGFVWTSFYFLSAGRWEIIVTAPNREGRKVVEVTTGSSTWTTVKLQPIPRRRLSIFDFLSGFTTPQRTLSHPDLAKLEAARLDDYSIVHMVTPKFGTGPVGVDWDPEFKVRGSTDETVRTTYLNALVPELHKRGTQFIPGYSLVQGSASGDGLTPNFLAMMEVPPASSGDQSARDQKLSVIDAHAIAIVDFFATEKKIPIDGIAFDIEIGRLKARHTEGLQRLMLQTAKELTSREPSGVIIYYTAAWVGPPSPVNNPHMAAFTFDFANAHKSLIARPMCFDSTRPYLATFVIRCADFGLTRTTAAKIQMAIRDREQHEIDANVPGTDFNAVVTAMAPRRVGVALMGTLKGMLDRAKNFDTTLNPGAERPGKKGNPVQVPLTADLP